MCDQIPVAENMQRWVRRQVILYTGLQDLLKATLPPTPLAFSGSCPCLETVDVDSNTSDADVTNSAMRFCLESTILYIPIILMVRADLSKGSVEPSE